MNSKFSFVLRSLPELLNIPIDSFLKQRSLLALMKLNLLLPVLLLESLQILPLDQKTLSVSKCGKFEPKQLLKAGNLADVHNHWLSLRDLLLRNDTVDESVS